MSKRLRFIKKPGPTHKTKIWRVRNTTLRSDLGLIRWFGRWRQYSFFPGAELVFEKTCHEGYC
jgi:hypothetical protein